MRAWYRLIRVAFRLIGLLAALVLLAATIYEHVGAWRDSRVLKQIGRSVDIGGRTLNIHCTGAGSPTVVFVSGRTSPGYVWTPTQRGVSAFTRACWYDRADIGWSDAGPDPAWGDGAARDLHRLVQNAGLRPLVLVGHSFGGHVIRLYQHTYPGEASGMVFVDAAHEDASSIQGMPHREQAADSTPGNSRSLDRPWPAWHDALPGVTSRATAEVLDRCGVGYSGPSAPATKRLAGRCESRARACDR